MKTLQEKEVVYTSIHINIYKYHSTEIGVDGEVTIEGDKTILMKVNDYKNTGLTYPILEYKDEQLTQIVEDMQAKIEQILDRPVRIIKQTDSDCDIKLTIYNMKTFSDKQKITLQLERETERIREVLHTLQILNNQTQEDNKGTDNEHTLQITNQQDQTDTIAHFAQIEPIDPSETISIEEIINKEGDELNNE